MKINKKVKSIILVGVVALSINAGAIAASAATITAGVTTSKPVVKMIDPPGG
ncbi:hypothetical protein [Clostridium estertheticum]|uniref:hypothetical protein n=1 Tax=Clostridium estertheticum TaxID=238834 RepID=UPI001CF37298|nr:hypothetical protein [Clostridium estertheticum]MCB2354475.1 hypothetical protein [Clostridium estertheticum]WAG42412.1 hypothetical protein LL065_06970 [Clostridium estertheticum]